MSTIHIACAFGEESILVKDALVTNLNPEIVEDFQKRIGTKILYRASRETDVVDLAIKALSKGLERGWDLSDVSTLLFVSENQRYVFPGNGHVLSANFGLFQESLILNINSGCTGFVDALAIGGALGSKCLLICAETYSKNIPCFKRSISPLFSDAASAVLIDFKDTKFELLHVINQTKDFSAISCEYGAMMRMEGATVYQFLLAKVVPALEKILESEKATEVFIHQGSGVVLSAFREIFKRYGIRLFSNLEERGNTVSVTLPLLMHDCIGDTIPIKNNRNIILVSFGVGLSASIGVLS
jgi:3-oxoacyl-[acyl-carrier-protein] synthase-3